MSKHHNKSWIHTAWDLFCIASVIGIWPRYIEPYFLTTTSLKIPIPHLPKELVGLKIAHLSDLHFNKDIPDRFLTSIKNKVDAFQPDIIALTGDFFCYSTTNDPERMTAFLSSLRAPHGCYAVLGNHDYSACISTNDAGEYQVTSEQVNFLTGALKRLFSSQKLTGQFSPRISELTLNSDLADILNKSQILLLNNETKCLPINGSFLNISGTEEYTSGRLDIDKMYKTYNPAYPGIILAHNPDAANKLKQGPGNLILSGHTHGGQINLPWIWRKLTLLEDPSFKSGLLSVANKQLYISRGLGSTFPFRWFAPPELVLITLESSS